MVNFKRILFPVEFTPQCKIAAQYVASYARHFEAEVSLLHVEILPFEPYVWEPRTDRLNQMLDQFLVDEFAGVKVRRHVAVGDPAQEIVRYANNEKADLIMMPTHGFGPLRRFLLGSVAAKVLHDAQCPVWTSVHTDAPIGLPRACRTILCALDSGESSVPLMQWAAWLAESYQAALKLVHVIPGVNETCMNPGERELRRYLFDQARDEFATRAKQAGVDVQVRLRGGEITPSVAATALEEKADLLVVGRGRLQRVLGGLRSNSLDLIRETPCPIISV